MEINSKRCKRLKGYFYYYKSNEYFSHNDFK